MSWSYETARDRAVKRYDGLADLTISDVVRELDFENISQLQPRRVTGTHLYAGVENFTALLGEADADGAEDLLLKLHLFAREASWIIKSNFDGCKVHFQGPRAHALAYRPVGDESKMVAKAVLTALALRHMVVAFNDVFELSDDAAWKLAAGIAHGSALATRNGAHGDRELLFLGSPANHAAKIIHTAGSIRMTETVKDLLPETFDDHVAVVSPGDAWYAKAVSAATVSEMAAAFGWAWSLDTTRARLEEAAERYPAGSATVSDVKEKIDKSKLAISSTKRVSGASVFADVDGFTSYIDGLEDDDDLIEAAKAFHVLRGGMRDSAVQDFDALRIQYQGDRMQALAYRPVGDESEVALEAVKLAAALTTLADQVILEVVEPTAAKRLAIGVAWGEVLVSKIGEQGHRDVVTIGTSTAEAAAIEGRLDGGQIGLNSALHSLLPDDVRTAFTWDDHAKAYVATDLPYDELLDLIDSNDSQQALGAVTGARSVPAVGAAAFVTAHGMQPSQPLKPWFGG